MSDFYIGLISGIFLGVILTIWAEFSAIKKQNIKEKIASMLPRKKGYIAGLSEDEESFKNSLKETEDTLIK